MDKVAALPGAEAVAYAAQTPLGESSMGVAIRLPEQPEKSDQRLGEVDAVTRSKPHQPVMGRRA
jgi:hypothetical protein